jgi:valyl-tRNA synthetase
MKPLAEPAIKAIKSGKIKFIPGHYKKIALHWLNNIIDWNISRQIVWGIPIPAKTCEKCQNIIIDTEDKINSCLSMHAKY